MGAASWIGLRFLFDLEQLSQLAGVGSLATATAAIILASRTSGRFLPEAGAESASGKVEVSDRIGGQEPGTAVRAHTVHSGVATTYGGKHIDFRDAGIAGDAIAVRNEYQPRAAPTALHALLPVPAAFTGREDDLEALCRALKPCATGPGSVVGFPSAAAAVVSGMGGIGKTALATVAAHYALQGGRFAGVVWVNLHGYTSDATPLTAEQALDQLLRALGVTDNDLPPTREEKAGLYRSQLTHVAGQKGGPVLVVADNAAAIAQVRPLLPGPGGHRLLVTSRHHMPTLTGARQLRLDTLTPTASTELLRALLDAADPQDERLDDLAGLEHLARLCAGLPLALQIAGALMARSVRHTPARVAARLENASRVAGLDDGEQALHTVFDLSFQELTPVQAEVFTLIGLAPGSTVSTGAASVLTGLDTEALLEVLEDLAAAHLLTDHPDGRWGMHDLLTDYIRHLAAPDHVAGGAEPGGHRAALVRLLDYYTTIAAAADVHLRALPGRTVPPTFTSQAQALAWMDAERATLIDAVHTALRIGHAPTAVRLPLALATYLDWRRYFEDWQDVSRVAQTTAHREGDQHREAQAWNNIGLALQEARRFEEAIEAHTRARTLHQEVGNRHREAQAWNNLGLAFQGARRFEEAIEAHTRARTLHQEVENRYREAQAANNFGLALQGARRFEEAIDAHRHALAYCQEVENRHCEGRAWNNIGTALRQVRRFGEAIEAHQRARDLFQEVGDRHRETMAWNNLGAALQEVRRFEEAIDAHRHALAYCRKVEFCHGEAMVANNLGLAFQGACRFGEAIEAHQRARDLFQEVGDRHREAMAWNNLGTALQEVRRFEEAIDAHRHDLAYCRKTRDRHGEAMARTNLGTALQGARRFGEAIEAHQCAGDLCRGVGDRHGEAMAANNFGLALQGARRFEEAIGPHQCARDLCRKVGDRHGEAMARTNLGLALLRDHRARDAVAALERAVVLFAEVGDEHRHAFTREILDAVRWGLGEDGEEG
ncbi:tetratricopeptide repeat protein [Allosalinactinospora lopnorensis]|uniref:tetratricopeptide repeat protein n=1 Tax=Allosalinactinospora lopnorensis TaxID=1352348 RepID=UPI001F336D2F|nr:tetratricopeptide repeat protein [Allosalinactinospora lopnorensis]